MSDAQRRQTWDDLWGLFIIIFLLIFVMDWLFYNGLIQPKETNSILLMIAKVFFKAQKALFIFRIFYAVSLVMYGWNMMSVKIAKKMTDDKRTFYRVMFICLTPLMIVGYHTDFFIYNAIIYPLILLAHMIVTFRAINTLGNKLKGENLLDGISNKESDFYFDFPTEKGILTVHSPQQHIFIEGGPGSGKSQSIIKPIVEQAAKRGYAGILYDFEGDPREPEAPILGRIAYTALTRAKNQGLDIKTNFSFINFTDMAKTVRVNPLSKRYITDRLDIQDLIQNMMTNLSVNKEKGADFWEKYGTAYIFGITWNLFKNHNEIATLPHVISIALNDIDTVLTWCSKDVETSMIMSPLISAWKAKAQGQLAGAETSAQLPVSILLDPKIFWVLSADEFNLDITNPDNAYLLCIGNSKKLQQALAPVISVLLTIIMKQMNSAGKVKSIFAFDEFPTVKVNGIDTFIATVRKHKSAVILALQDFTQAERDYSKNNAHILRTSCGSHFYGMTGNLETGRYVSNMLGEIKKENTSYSTSQDSISTSESLQKEKQIQERDVMGQNIGHFTGKIAGGKPPFFSVQFDEFKYKDEPIPDFAYKISTGDINTDKMILDNLIEDNYKTIIRQAKELLDIYRVNSETE